MRLSAVRPRGGGGAGCGGGQCGQRQPGHLPGDGACEAALPVQRPQRLADGGDGVGGHRALVGVHGQGHGRVAGEHGVERAGEQVGVADRGGRRLPARGRHGVHGVAERGDGSARPGREVGVRVGGVVPEAADAAQAGGSGRRAARQGRRDPGADAVRADEQVGALHPAVGEVRDDRAVAVHLVADELRPEPLVGVLVDRGLVRRDGPGGRGRRHGLAITEAGRALYDAALPGVVAFHGPEATGLSPDQLATLEDLLQTLLRARSR